MLLCSLRILLFCIILTLYAPGAVGRVVALGQAVYKGCEIGTQANAMGLSATCRTRNAYLFCRMRCCMIPNRGAQCMHEIPHGGGLSTVRQEAYGINDSVSSVSKGRHRGIFMSKTSIESAYSLSLYTCNWNYSLSLSVIGFARAKGKSYRSCIQKGKRVSASLRRSNGHDTDITYKKFDRISKTQEIGLEDTIRASV